MKHLGDYLSYNHETDEQGYATIPNLSDLDLCIAQPMNDRIQRELNEIMVQLREIQPPRALKGVVMVVCNINRKLRFIQAANVSNQDIYWAKAESLPGNLWETIELGQIMTSDVRSDESLENIQIRQEAQNV